MSQLSAAQAVEVQSVGKMLAWAMAWSQGFGVPVLPCGPDKGPMTKGGKDDATTDPARIIEWWTRWPDALIGGRTDGLVVLDFDAYKPGHAADLAELGELPPTREFSTPGHEGTRGRHLVYRDPTRARRSGKLGKNRTIDVRSGASMDYVILPPSQSSEGIYEPASWRPVAVAPTWLLDSSRAAVAAHPDDLPDCEPVPAGVRVMVRREVLADPNEHTYELIKQALRAGYSPGQVRTLAENDPVTIQRRAEPKRQQPSWWPSEFMRCLRLAQAEINRAEDINEHSYLLDEEDGKQTAAQRVMRIAIRDYDLVRSLDNVPYAVPRVGPRLVRQLRGGVGSMRAAVAAQFEQEIGHPPSNNALAEMLTVLEGRAGSKPAVNLPIRTAWDGGQLVLDLGDQEGRAVVIRPGGWEVVDRSPVLFRRTDLTRELPLPRRGGRLRSTLFPLLNLPAADKSLMVSAVLSWLWPDIDHPVIYLRGEEGTAKSSMARLLRSLVDPSSVDLRRQPGKDEDWEVAVAGQAVVVLDNLSKLPDWLSDAICTAVTGVGDVRRRLYQDQELSVISVRRSFILTSIESLIARGDLVDRSILFEPEPIPAFRTRADLARTWEAARPLALGALLDLAARVLEFLPAVQSSGDFARERMSDYAQIAAAMDMATGSRTVDRYRQKVSDGIRASVETDAFAVHVMALADQSWSGSPAELFDTYKVRIGRVGSSDTWPKSPVAVGQRLARLGGILRKSGVQAARTRNNQGTVWTFTRL